MARRKIKFRQADWEADHDGTLIRWLRRYMPRVLAKLWLSYPPRRRAKDAAEKSGCQACGKRVPREELEVDHIKPRGPMPESVIGWGQYLVRTFCHPGNLRGICSGCHKVKTREDRKR